MKDQEEKLTGFKDSGKKSEGNTEKRKITEENTKKEKRMEDMLIGAIYDKIFVPMSEKSGRGDEAMNEKLMLLVSGADMEHICQADVADLICRGAVIGQKEGFICGFRFAAKLLCNMLS